MAIGEFGAVIDESQLDTQIIADYPPAKVFDAAQSGKYIFITHGYSHSFITYSYDTATGDIAKCDEFTPVSGLIGSSAPTYIADGVIAYIGSDSSPSKLVIITISINTDGTYNSKLGEFNIGSYSLSYPKHTLRHLTGTYYAGVGNYVSSGNYYSKAWVLSIGADGLSGSLVDSLITYDLPDGGYYQVNAARLSNTDFMGVFGQYQGTGYVVVETYNLTGGTLTKTDSLSVDSDCALDANSYIGVVEIQDGIFLLGYKGQTYRRLRTFDCDVDGNIGSLIDTANDYFSSDFYQLFMLTTGYAVVASDDEAVSFSVAADGTIGSVIDTWATGHSPTPDAVFFAYVDENYYVGHFTGGALTDTWGFSVEIVSELALTFAQTCIIG